MNLKKLLLFSTFAIAILFFGSIVFAANSTATNTTTTISNATVSNGTSGQGVICEVSGNTACYPKCVPKLTCVWNGAGTGLNPSSSCSNCSVGKTGCVKIGTCETTSTTTSTSTTKTTSTSTTSTKTTTTKTTSTTSTKTTTTKITTTKITTSTTTVPQVKILIKASDSRDSYLRYAKFFNLFPVAYHSYGDYGNKSVQTSYFYSGDRVSHKFPINQSLFYFAITQSGGASYGTYSGTMNVSSNSTSNSVKFSGLDAFHVLKVILSNASIVNYSIISLPSAHVSNVTQPPISNVLRVYITASNPNDSSLRYAEFFNKFPGAYQSYGDYANKSTQRTLFSSGGNVSYTPSKNQSSLYFIIAQSGGPIYGNYSGTLRLMNNSINESVSFGPGLDAYHALLVYIHPNLSALIVPLPISNVTTPPTTIGIPNCELSGDTTCYPKCGSGSTCVWDRANVGVSPASDCDGCSVGTIGCVRIGTCEPIQSSSTISTTIQTTTTILPLTNYTLQLNPGWNLFSVPLTYATKLNTTCAKGVIESPIWQLLNGKYVKASLIYGGTGYWVKAASACSVTFRGPSLTLNEIPSLTSGWNIFGALNYTTDFSNMSSNCDVLRGPYGFNTTANLFYETSSITTGNGYLVRLGSSCTLGSAPPPISMPIPPPPTPI